MEKKREKKNKKIDRQSFWTLHAAIFFIFFYNLLAPEP